MNKKKLEDIIHLALDESSDPLDIIEGEVIVTSILASIMKFVMHEIRLHCVRKLESNYISDKCNSLIKNIITLDFVSPQIDTEMDDMVFIGDKKLLQIDPWAFNRTKVLFMNNTLIEENESICSDINNIKATELKDLKETINLKELWPMKSGLIPLYKKKNKDKTFDDPYGKSHLFGMDTKTISKRPSKAIIIKNFLSRTKDHDEISRKSFKTDHSQGNNETSIKKSTKNLELKDKKEIPDNSEKLPKNPNEIIDLNNETVIEIMRYRKIIEEKERERIMKEKYARELEERAKEEEIKKRKIMEEMSKKPTIFSYDGKILKVFKTDPDRLAKTIPQPDSKIELTSERVTKKQPKRKDESKLAIGKPDIIDYRFEPTQFNSKEYYFQPDPLQNINLNPGVNFEFYGKIKNGEEYPHSDQQMNEREFKELLNYFRPTNTKTKLADIAKSINPKLDQNNLDKNNEKNLSHKISEKEGEDDDQITSNHIVNILMNEDEKIEKMSLKPLKEKEEKFHKKILSCNIKANQNAKKEKDKKTKINKFTVNKLNDFDLKQIAANDSNGLYEYLNDSNQRDKATWNINNGKFNQRKVFKSGIDDNIPRNRNKKSINEKILPRITNKDKIT